MKRLSVRPADDGEHMVGLIAIVILLAGLIWLLVVRDGGRSEARAAGRETQAGDTTGAVPR